MKKLTILTPLFITVLCGCARFSTTQTDNSYADSGKPQRSVTTHASAFTLFDAKNALTSFKASQTDKTQSATVGGLNQESTTTNGVAALHEIGVIMSNLPK